MKLLAILLTLFLLNMLLLASEKEDTIRAVVLERISQFISYDDYTTKAFIICVYKDKDLAKVFKSLYDGRKYKNRKIKVVQVDSVDDIKACDILYAHDLDKFTVKKIVAIVLNKTLLVTQDEDAINYGFMIAMYFENKKIKFAINHGAIINADLKVNYRLLKVATKVINPPAKKVKDR